VVFNLVVVIVLWLFYTGGLGVGVLVLLLPVLVLLWCLRNDPAQGSVLEWRQGIWTLQRAGVESVVALAGSGITTPWVIYLSFNDLSVNRGGHLWVYADSAPQEQWRRLRVRVTLKR
jgi:hypothetical protein